MQNTGPGAASQLLSFPAHRAESLERSYATALQSIATETGVLQAITQVSLVMHLHLSAPQHRKSTCTQAQNLCGQDLQLCVQGLTDRPVGEGQLS